MRIRRAVNVLEPVINILSIIFSSSPNKNKSNFSIFNLGSGNGVSVLEAIAAFEKISGKKLNYQIGQKRDGDVGAIYSDNSFSEKTLGWTPKYNLEDMMRSAWKWELELSMLE